MGCAHSLHHGLQLSSHTIVVSASCLMLLLCMHDPHLQQPTCTPHVQQPTCTPEIPPNMLCAKKRCKAQRSSFQRAKGTRWNEAFKIYRTPSARLQQHTHNCSVQSVLEQLGGAQLLWFCCWRAVVLHPSLNGPPLVCATVSCHNGIAGKILQPCLGTQLAHTLTSTVAHPLPQCAHLGDGADE